MNQLKHKGYDITREVRQPLAKRLLQSFFFRNDGKQHYFFSFSFFLFFLANSGNESLGMQGVKNDCKHYFYF